MARKRKGGLASLAEGFNAGYDTVGKVVQDFRLADVENTKPEDTGYNKPGGEINAPDPEKYAYDSDTGTYVPKTMAAGLEIPEDQRAPAVDGQTPQFSQGERVKQWSMNGKTFNEHPTDQQIATEKSKMRAGVYRGMGNDKEADALEANALTREAAGLTIDKARREADADAAGRTAFEASPLGAASKQYRESVSAYQKAGGKNPDGSPMELPQMPALTAGDHLNTAVSVALATRNPDMIGKALDMQKKVRDEGMPRVMTLLNAGAPKDVLARAFSESGTVTVDPANLSDPKPATVEISPGVTRKTWEITHTDPRTGKQITYNALRELDAYGKAKDIIDRDLKEREVKVKEKTADALATTRQQNADTRTYDQMAKEMGGYGGRGGAGGSGTIARERWDETKIKTAVKEGANYYTFDSDIPDGKAQTSLQGQHLYTQLLRSGIDGDAAEELMFNLRQNAKDKTSYDASVTRVLAEMQRQKKGAGAPPPAKPASVQGSAAPSAAPAPAQPTVSSPAPRTAIAPRAAAGLDSVRDYNAAIAEQARIADTSYVNPDARAAAAMKRDELIRRRNASMGLQNNNELPMVMR